jgi:hypothetical protein
MKAHDGLTLLGSDMPSWGFASFSLLFSATYN